MARTWGRKGRPWTRVQARVYAEETACFLCGRYVDQTLPNYRSAMARSVHHLIPPDVARHLANNRDNLRLAHIGCNASYGRGRFKGAPSPRGPRPRGTARVGTRARGYARTRVGVGQAAPVTQSDRDW
jgi:hypothetical protein